MTTLGVITLGSTTLGVITLGSTTLGVTTLGVTTLGSTTLGVITLDVTTLGVTPLCTRAEPYGLCDCMPLFFERNPHLCCVCKYSPEL